MQRLLLIVAGLVGASGVAAAAASAHMAEQRNLAAIAAICLSHGPALLALGLYGDRRFHIVGWLLATGTVLFAADLALREWAGHGAFPGAAPLAGAGMVLGWAGIGAASFFRRR